MAMKKILNARESIVSDTLKGYVAAHSEIIRLVPGTHIVERMAPKSPGKVRLLMGNGAGHEPAVICWVGEGMFDMNIPGEIFTCASSSQILDGIKRLGQDGPVLLAVQNHSGDVLNARIALDEALYAGINVKSVLFWDDIASAPRSMCKERRGIGGMIFYSKILGAMAERGDNIDALIEMFERVRDVTRTYAFAVTNCTHPISGQSLFADLPEDEIELGMGVHGEGGGTRIKLPTSKALAKMLCDKLIEDGEYKQGDNLLVFLNGSGGITTMELSILYGDIKEYLETKQLVIVGCKVGNYLTTQELSGASLSLCAVDDEMLALWKQPCRVSKF